MGYTCVAGSPSMHCLGTEIFRFGRKCLKRDGTSAETRFGLSAKRTSPFKLAGGVSSVDYRQPRCAHQRL